MLTIGKPTRFGADGMAVPGQCRPDTAGWNLRWFVRGEETVLYSGTLTACRRYMGLCRGLTDLAAMKRAASAPLLGETVEMPALAPTPTEVYPPVDGDAAGRRNGAHRKRGKKRKNG